MLLGVAITLSAIFATLWGTAVMLLGAAVMTSSGRQSEQGNRGGRGRQSEGEKSATYRQLSICFF